MTAVEKTHVKFGDDVDTNLEKNAKSKVGTGKPVDKYAISDSESEDEEDAPEEEGMSQSRETVDHIMKIREDAKKLEEKALKEKRRQQNKAFSKQQKESKERKTSLKNSQIEEVGELEELPEDFFDKLETAESNINSVTSIPKHINFNEIEIDDKYIPEVKEQLKKKKRKTLKKLRATSSKKGPVTVTVLSESKNTSTMAPKREIQVLSTKDRWLKRKSVYRKK